jgi:ethanolamine ammonia-lyase small subunit
MSLIKNPWESLRTYTDARIALGRCGTSIPTGAHLAFQMSHAIARDAVHQRLDLENLKTEISKTLQSLEEPIILHSAAVDRKEYLIRPDLGRKLSEASREQLMQKVSDAAFYDIALILGDGLSARAMETNAIPFLKAFLPLLKKNGKRVAPPTLVQQCRVACGDEISNHWKAKLTVMLIGERPGLSSPDSMGIYLTWNPGPERTTDADRNCISNVRPDGLRWPAAAEKLAYLIEKAFRLQLTGVDLKDDQITLQEPAPEASAIAE